MSDWGATMWNGIVEAGLKSVGERRRGGVEIGWSYSSSSVKQARGRGGDGSCQPRNAEVGGGCVWGGMQTCMLGQEHTLKADTCVHASKGSAAGNFPGVATPYAAAPTIHYPLSTLIAQHTCSSVSILGPSTMSIISSTEGWAGNRGRCDVKREKDDVKGSCKGLRGSARAR